MKEEITEGDKQYAVRFARKGGIARAKKLSKKRRVEIAVLAANKRWSKNGGKR